MSEQGIHFFLSFNFFLLPLFILTIAIPGGDKKNCKNTNTNNEKDESGSYHHPLSAWFIWTRKKRKEKKRKEKKRKEKKRKEKKRKEKKRKEKKRKEKKRKRKEKEKKRKEKKRKEKKRKKERKKEKERRKTRQSGTSSFLSRSNILSNSPHSLLSSFFSLSLSPLSLPPTSKFNKIVMVIHGYPKSANNNNKQTTIKTKGNKGDFAPKKRFDTLILLQKHPPFSFLFVIFPFFFFSSLFTFSLFFFFFFFLFFFPFHFFLFSSLFSSLFSPFLCFRIMGIVILNTN